MKLVIATTVLALTAGTAFAQEADVKLPELSKPEIAFLDAAAIADKAADGDLVSMDLDYIEETDPVYLAELENDKGFARLMIDGDSGDVLVSETVDAQTEKALADYMENFSTQAEIAEMAALQEMIGDDVEELDLSEEELKELAEALREVDEGLLDDVTHDADIEN